jgi:hypothetical protein
LVSAFSKLKFDDLWTDFSKLAFMEEEYDDSWIKIILTDAKPDPKNHSREFDELILKRLEGEAILIKVKPTGIEIPSKVLTQSNFLREYGVSTGLLTQENFLTVMDLIVPALRRDSSEAQRLLNEFTDVSKKSNPSTGVAYKIPKWIPLLAIVCLAVIVYFWSVRSKEKQKIKSIIGEDREQEMELHVSIIQREGDEIVELREESIFIPEGGREVTIGSGDEDTIVISNDKDPFISPRQLLISVNNRGQARYRLLQDRKWFPLIIAQSLRLSEITEVELNLLAVEDNIEKTTKRRNHGDSNSHR